MLEHKFWFDELYDADLLQAGRPAHARAPARGRGAADRRLDLRGVGSGTRETAGAVGEAQTGYLRSYALAIALAVAILVVVFVTVQ